MIHETYHTPYRIDNNFFLRGLALWRELERISFSRGCNAKTAECAGSSSSSFFQSAFSLSPSLFLSSSFVFTFACPPVPSLHFVIRNSPNQLASYSAESLPALCEFRQARPTGLMRALGSNPIQRVLAAHLWACNSIYFVSITSWLFFWKYSSGYF